MTVPELRDMQREMTGNKSNIISALRADILRLEGFRAHYAGSSPHVSDPIHHAFPGAAFPSGATHEFLLSAIENFSATGAFITMIVSSWLNTKEAIVWIGAEQKLMPSALEPFGIAPDRFLFARVMKEKDLLWVTEEALKCPAVGAVVSEVMDMSFTASRRLQLAVEESRTTGFIIRPDRLKLTPTACVSRWRVSQLPSESIDDLPGIGFPKWKVELLRVRNGQPGVWNVQWAEQQLTYLSTYNQNKYQPAKAG